MFDLKPFLQIPLNERRGPSLVMKSRATLLISSLTNQSRTSLGERPLMLLLIRGTPIIEGTHRECIYSP